MTTDTVTGHFFVPARDMADYNPGHGTNTVRQETDWIKENSAVTVTAKRIDSKIWFTVVGAEQDVAALLKLVGQA